MSESWTHMLQKWAEQDPQIHCLLLVGSYARGTYTEASDLDVVVIVENPDDFLADTSFLETFGTVLRHRTEEYGACTSIRAWYASGWEVEFGIVAPSWIAAPLDPGTRRVLRDGYQVVLDKQNYFKRLDRSAF